MKRLAQVTSGVLIVGTLLATGGTAVGTATSAAAVPPTANQASTIQPTATPVGAPKPTYLVLPHGSLSFNGTTPVSARITKGNLTKTSNPNVYVGNIYAQETVNGVTSKYRMAVDVTGISSNTMGIEIQLASNNKPITAACGVLIGRNYRYSGTIDAESGGPNVTINGLTLVVRPTS